MASLFIKYLYLLTLIAGSITARLITRQPTSPDKETVLPGRSGWERNDATGETDIKYGDDWLKGHMNHLSRNQAQYPSNRDFMGVTKDDTNRKSALHNVEPATRHRTLKYQQVRDEKLPNMLNNPNHDTQTTVEHREKAESDGKGRPSLDHTDGGERQRSGTNYGVFALPSHLGSNIDHSLRRN